ncbi:hypothetical protein [Bradyrhizobium sp. CCBAU 11386]|uniref:hypothetical protein n=1 Tax=Bradyrhizobium sp. CCBAU 11386 TaxID=1630837 RepID=UPI0023033909|nr:hypothetical protein [Bradyrhizobium sp. CCBAU 11386]
MSTGSSGLLFTKQRMLIASEVSPVKAGRVLFFMFYQDYGCLRSTHGELRPKRERKSNASERRKLAGPGFVKLKQAPDAPPGVGRQ